MLPGSGHFTLSVPLSSSAIPQRSSIAPTTGASLSPEIGAPAPPPLAEQEIVDLSALAGRDLTEEQARRFWKNLVLTAAFHRMLEGAL